ncbi:MAG: alanine racemase [Candidatus Kapaibacteriales bacterium]
MRTTVAKIDLDKLYHNYLEIRKIIQGRKLISVVKANAYGHGLIRISQALQEFGTDYLAVAFSTEGVALRKSGITIPIIVLVPENDNSVEEGVDFDLDYSIDSFYLAKRISDYAKLRNKVARLHIYVDTGMGRDGFHYSTVSNFFENIKRLPNIELVGLMSHFATSGSDLNFAKVQLDRFNSVIKWANDIAFHFDHVHMANSGAILTLPEAFFNAVRVGLLLYGYLPNPTLGQKHKFFPILEIHSKVVSERIVEKGESVGYDRAFIATEKTRIVTVPIGYGDGFWRRLSSGKCLIRGKQYPIVGGVCMDEIMVDVGLNSNVKIGDEVVLLGNQNKAEISGYELAKIANTIVYEITTSISDRIPRVYHNNGLLK